MRPNPVRLARVSAAAIIAIVSGSPVTAFADNIRCMALTGAQAAGLPAGARYATLGQGSIGTGGQIVFTGSLQTGTGGVTAANDAVVWSISPAGVTNIIARKGSTVGDFPAGAIYSEFGRPALDPLNGSVSFWARLAQGNGIDATNDRAIFRHSGGASFLHMQCGSPFFGVAEGPVFDLDNYRHNPTLHFSGQPAQRVRLVTGAGGVPADQAEGIWGPDLNGDIVVVAQQGNLAHDVPAGTRYEANFSTPVMSRVGDIAYRANLRLGAGGVDATNNLGIWMWIPAEEVHYLLARTGDLLGHGDVAEATLETMGQPVITAEPRVGFHGTMRLGVAGITSDNDEGLFTRCPCGSVFLYAREGQQAPGLQEGAVFSTFSDPIFSEDGRMMFAASLRGSFIDASNDTSLWWSDSTVSYVMVAHEGRTAPGGGGATFANFDFAAPDFWMGTTRANQLVFSAVLSNGVHGIWAYTPSRGVRCIAKEGDSVEVAPGDMRQIISLAPWSESTAHSGRRTPVSLDGHLTFSASVTGGATGIFLADLPAPLIGCSSDWNNDLFINSQDFFDFIADFFSGTADVNSSGFTDSQDLFDFLIAFFSGC